MVRCPLHQVEMQRPLLIGIGEILWDMLPAGRQLGGAPANFAYHANALGGRGAVVSRVGDDPLGREILDRLDTLGVDRTFVSVDSVHPTGTVEVKLDERGVPDYEIRRHVAWDHLPQSPAMLDLAAQASCVCFGSLGQRSSGSRDAIQAFLRATNDACLRIFDVNLRQNYYSQELIEQLMALTNVLKLNDQELPVVARLIGLDTDESVAVHTLIGRYSLRAVALTRGAAGSSIYLADGHMIHQPPEAVQVADTVGAGDAFTASLAMGFLKGLALADISQNAAHVAAYVCSQRGATPTMPNHFSIVP
jgi:fructokinase